MKNITSKGFFKASLLIVYLLFSLIISSQTRNDEFFKAKKCTTYVYNLTTGEMRIRDICISITNTEHIDMNFYNIGKPWDIKKDYWKFQIEITDNDKSTTESFNASFYVFEESDEIKQYHCLIENSDFKAIIFNKINKCWQVLLLQNDEYKILSCYSGYRFTNAFGINPKSKSRTDY